MRRLSIFLVLSAIAAAGAVAWVMLPSPVRPPAPSVQPVDAQPRDDAPVFAHAPPAKPRHLRRLLSTRLGHPKALRIERVRVSRVPQYAGVSCGEVAVGEHPEAATDFRRFIATKRIVHVEGASNFEALWSKVCAAKDATRAGSPPRR